MSIVVLASKQCGVTVDPSCDRVQRTPPVWKEGAKRSAQVRLLAQVQQRDAMDPSFEA